MAVGMKVMVGGQWVSVRPGTPGSKGGSAPTPVDPGASAPPVVASGLLSAAQTSPVPDASGWGAVASVAVGRKADSAAMGGYAWTFTPLAAGVASRAGAGAGALKDPMPLDATAGEVTLTAKSASVSRPGVSGVPWWSSDAPINADIPANPVLDTNSASIVAALSTGTKVLALGEYGVTVRRATATTPKWSITPTQNWGANPFAGVQVPIDMSWPTNPAGDGHLVVISEDGMTQFDLWKADLSGSAPVVQWGGISDPTGPVITDKDPGHATGSGIARGAGIIRADEWASALTRGYFDHALVFSTDIAAVSAYRFPAKKTDGSNMRGVAASAALPEGARIQLDPSIDVSTITPVYARLVARTLQVKGAYCVDNGGTAVSILCEYAPGSFKTTNAQGAAVWQPNAGAPVGITKDWAGLSAVPWGSVRVLKSWNGA